MTIIPRATYRLQFHQDFTFADATKLVPYLAALGVSHLYASPYLKARAGSVHGYDIVDHNALNPEIGTTAEFEALIEALHAHGLRQMLDIVPNHMGVMDAGNAWWLDVLEHGRASRYAEYFDIDWEPLSEELRGKVLIPVLGDQYGAVLEKGELKVIFDAAAGAFSLSYYQHRFPLDPHEYRLVFGSLDADHAPPEAAAALASLLDAFAQLPVGDESAPEIRETRAQRAADLKRELAALCLRLPAIAELIAQHVARINGGSENFQRLHDLIKAQSFRLAYWHVAADDINYRRFFDINDLAALRMERGAVFDDTHRLVLRLVAEGKVDALRIDHPDGLYDPAAYFAGLQSAVARIRGGEPPAAPAVNEDRRTLPIYLVIEKILAEHERLPSGWRVHGTSGYRFTNVLNGLFVDGDAETKFDRIYHSFIGHALYFDDLLREAKIAVMNNALSSELNVLATMLNRVAKADRHTCDFTLNSLRQALIDVVACFPVYRTYITDAGASEEDRRDVAWAVAVAKRHRRAAEHSVLDFVATTLLDGAAGKNALQQARVRRFAGRFQQFTSPVMAKGTEDTSFYVYNRLVSLNEVGGEPRTFGLTPAAFHAASGLRARLWPNTMLATSTHDTKRSEDVRARIDVLSEMPGQWRLALRRWRQINRRRKRTVDGEPAPSRNDEYLLYQTLLGAWPPGVVGGDALVDFAERIQRYMLKAAREAKVWTSWIFPNEEYEQALAAFVAALLAPSERNLFLNDFLQAQVLIERFGFYNGLAQTVLKFASHGVPDLYQGTELWDFSLVDPDNRRPVDYAHREHMLDSLRATFAPLEGSCAAAARALLDTLPDGRAKLYITWRALALRSADSALFEASDYIPLRISGAKAAHVCAFARVCEGRAIIAVAPRLFYKLLNGGAELPLGAAVWGDTRVELPPSLPPAWRNVLTGEPADGQVEDGTSALPLAALLASFPVALLQAR